MKVGSLNFLGRIDPLTFLKLAGADVRYYRTTTFLHTKFIQTDKSTVVSSVNYSYTSFMLNREAGWVIVSQVDWQSVSLNESRVLLQGSSDITDLYNKAFFLDFSAADVFVPNQAYSPEDMAVIQNTWVNSCPSFCSFSPDFLALNWMSPFLLLGPLQMLSSLTFIISLWMHSWWPNLFA